MEQATLALFFLTFFMDIVILYLLNQFNRKKDVIMNDGNYVKQTVSDVPIIPFSVAHKTTKTMNKYNFTLRYCVCEGKKWFYALDIVDDLGYTNKNQAIRDYVSDLYKMRIGGKYGKVVISIDGLLGLLLLTKTSTAKQYNDLITNEVLSDESIVTTSMNECNDNYTVNDVISDIYSVGDTLSKIKGCDAKEAMEFSILLHRKYANVNDKILDDVMLFIGEKKKDVIVHQKKKDNVNHTDNLLMNNDDKMFMTVADISKYVLRSVGLVCSPQYINDFLVNHGYQKCVWQRKYVGTSTRIFAETELAVHKDMVRIDDKNKKRHKIYWHKEKLALLLKMHFQNKTEK